MSKLKEKQKKKKRSLITVIPRKVSTQNRSRHGMSTDNELVNPFGQKKPSSRKAKERDMDAESELIKPYPTSKKPKQTKGKNPNSSRYGMSTRNELVNPFKRKTPKKKKQKPK